MVRFIDLHEIHRQQLYRKWREGCDPKEAFKHVFGGVNATCALKTVKNMFRIFDNSSKEVIENYIHPSGRKGSAGAKRKHSEVI